MTLCRLLLHSIRRYSSYPNHSPYSTSAASNSYYAASNHHPPHNPHKFPYPNSDPFYPSNTQNPHFTSADQGQSYSAEEAVAERRRRRRRMRVEPPLYALRPKTQPPLSKPQHPDNTTALVGPRLKLHDRVQSLIRADDLDAASYVARLSFFEAVPVRPTVFTCNAIMGAMYRAKRYNDAKALFQYFFRQMEIIPNIVSYNNLIVTLCESNQVEEALEVYGYILENAPYTPSPVTYRHLTKGLIDAGRIDDSVSLLREMLLKGHGVDSLVYNNVILGFLNLGNLERANALLDELKERCLVYDGVVNATFMDWYFNQGKPKEAMESYRDLMARNYRMVPATKNVLLETLLRHGKKKEAWDLFHDMLNDHTPPSFEAVDSDTFNLMVNECFKEGKVQEAMEVFARSGKGVKSRPFQMDVAGFNNMIMRLCELEMMDEAEQYYQQLCDNLLSPDVHTYRTLIDGYIKVDRVDDMIEKYTKMVEAGLRVIPPYANKWFGYLIEKGRASDCFPILSEMADIEPKPDVTTYDIVIKGLVKEDNFDATASLMSEIMNQRIGTTPSLTEFVLDAFERKGLRKVMENILNSLPSPLYTQRGREPAMHWQTTASPQMPSSHQFTCETSLSQVARLPEMVVNVGRKSAMHWETTSSLQMSHAHQFANETSQPQMTEQLGYPYPISYANQFTHQTSQPQMKEQMGYPQPMPPVSQAVKSCTINMMVNKCFKEGKVQEAMEVFAGSRKGVKSKPFQMNVAGFNIMITRLCELEMIDEAEQYFKQLHDESLSPDVDTYRTLIDAYIKVDKADNVIEKYTEMVEAGFWVIPPYANKWFVYLIEKGRASDCFPILSKMANIEPKPDVTTYDIVIRGLVHVEEDNLDAVACLIREMMNKGIEPTHSLKDFVLGVFEGQGLRREMENILKRCPSPLNSQRPYQGAQGPPGISRPPEIVEQGGSEPAVHWQTSYSLRMSNSHHFTHGTSQPRGAYPPEMVEKEGRKPTIHKQTPSSPHMPNLHQFTHGTIQRQGAKPPEMVEHGGRMPTIDRQTASPHMSNSHQHAHSTSQPQGAKAPVMVEHEGREPATQWQTSSSPQMSYSNQFKHETSQPQMTEQMGYPHSMSCPNQLTHQTNQPQIIEQTGYPHPIPPAFLLNSDSINMMVNECFEEGKVEEAKVVFARFCKGVKSMPFQMDVSGYNNMIMRLCELEMMDEAEQYFKQLCDQSLSPDVNTYSTLIDAHVKLDRVDDVIEKYKKMVEAGLRVIPPYANKWFAYLIEKGRASDCLHILTKMADLEPKPDVSTYDMVIRGLVKKDDLDATANQFTQQISQPQMTEQMGHHHPMSYSNQFTYQTSQALVTDLMGQQNPMWEQEDEFSRMAGQNAS